MSDLIKREDAIKALNTEARKQFRLDDSYAYVIGTLRNVEDAIRAIPSADRWIPCEERLPSEQGQYLVTVSLCNGEPWVDVLSFCKGKFYETDDEWGDVEYDNVTAWMSLPKPWKG